MESERRFIGGYSDAPTAEALKQIAVIETEGNVSQALRKVVREAAKRRGVALTESNGAEAGHA